MGPTASRVAIAGAGPGGLAAAIALVRAGVEATVFEAAPEPRVGGGALVLWPNGSRALAALVDAFPASAVRYDRAVVRAWDGRLIQDLPVGIHGRHYGGDIVALPRPDLQATLLGAVPPGGVQYGAPVERFTADDTGLDVYGPGGHLGRFDALVGADGLHSRVRHQLAGPSEPRRARLWAWLGTSGPVGGPVHAGVLTTTEGRGLRFLHLPLLDGRAWWYAYTHDDAGVVTRRDLRRAFRGWHPPIVDVIDATPDEDLIHVDLRDRPPLATWGKGRVTLLGDAAHPCTPDLGQGVGLALEDALALADTIDASVDRWFRAYERRRAERAERLQRASWQISQSTLPGSPLGCQLRQAGFAAVPPELVLAWLGSAFQPS